jgi:hypothetical protein
MRQQHGLEFRWRNLVGLVLDQLLEPVDDRKRPVLVEVGDVSGVQPAVTIHGIGGRGGLIEVSLHDLKTADPNLAALARTERLAGDRIDNLRLRVRRKVTDFARLVLARDRDVRHRARLS